MVLAAEDGDYFREPDIVFGERVGDVFYQVHAWSEENGILLALPFYNTFEDMIDGLYPDLPRMRARMMAKSEYSKCIVSAAKGLRVQGNRANYNNNKNSQQGEAP